jgi:phospholipid N-methyltransferase
VIIKTYKKIREEGLIISSSGFLVRSMLNKIDFSQPLKILETGSGNGVFTKAIIHRLAAGSEFNGQLKQLIDKNPEKNITLYNGCILNVLAGNNDYDVIISSLPLKNFTRLNDGDVFLNRVIESFKSSLKDGGTYLQYQYFKSNKQDIERVFGKRMDEISFVPLNILPAFVYNMTKLPATCEQREVR